LVDLDPMAELVPEGRMGGIGYGDVLSISERVFLAPQHERLVTLASSRDRLVSRGFDLIAALDRSGIDYLFVDSVPPLIAEPGRTYRYRIQVRSRAGGVKLALDSGPEGMVLSRDGTLEWDVPARMEPGQSGVIITVEDASGQTLLHSFTIRTEGERTPSRPRQPGLSTPTLSAVASFTNDPERLVQEPPHSPQGMHSGSGGSGSTGSQGCPEAASTQAFPPAASG
jgi:hypothetical protein